MKLEELKHRGLFDQYYHEIEFNFLLIYYFNTLHIIFTRFQQVPLDIIEQMRKEVYKNFPNYRNNPYIPDHLINLYKALMYTLDHTLSQTDWNQIVKAYNAC